MLLLFSKTLIEKYFVPLTNARTKNCTQLAPEAPAQPAPARRRICLPAVPCLTAVTACFRFKFIFVLYLFVFNTSAFTLYYSFLTPSRAKEVHRYVNSRLLKNCSSHHVTYTSPSIVGFFCSGVNHTKEKRSPTNGFVQCRSFHPSNSRALY